MVARTVESNPNITFVAHRDGTRILEWEKPVIRVTTCIIKNILWFITKLTLISVNKKCTTIYSKSNNKYNKIIIIFWIL